MLTQFLPLVLVFGIVYFFMIRPQQRRARAHQAMLDGLKKGDLVVTNAGLIGKIDSINETEVSLELAEGVVVQIVKQAVAELRSQEHNKKKDNPKEKKDKAKSQPKMGLEEKIEHKVLEKAPVDLVE